MSEFFVYLTCSVFLLWYLQPVEENLSKEETILRQEIKQNETIKNFEKQVEKLENFYKDNKDIMIRYDHRPENTEIVNRTTDNVSSSYTSFTYFDTEFRRDYIFFWNNYTIKDNCGIWLIILKEDVRQKRQTLSHFTLLPPKILNRLVIIRCRHKHPNHPTNQN